jgi:hypothetical protein
MKPPKRHVIEGRVSRVYENGGILLSEPGETLEQMSEGAVRERSPGAEKLSTCLLCQRPSAHWGLFMTAEEILSYQEKPKGGTTGTFFGLCDHHDPHEKEDEVCDAVYKVMEDQLSVEDELEMAEVVMGAWLEQLLEEGFTEEESFQTMLSLLGDGKLTVRGYAFSEKMKQVMQILLEGELRKRSQ